MANLDNPNGFTPVRHLTGGIIRAEELAIADGTAAAIFSGDSVTLLATGYISVGTAATTNAVGVFAGCSYTALDGTPVWSTHWPAAAATQGASDAVAYVYTDPNIVYAVQHDEIGLFADVGALFDLTATAGSLVNGRSKQELDTSASTVDMFRQIGLVKRVDNEWGANAEVEVVIHKHAYTAAAGAAI